jgi:hypothetical protein
VWAAIDLAEYDLTRAVRRRRLSAVWASEDTEVPIAQMQSRKQQDACDHKSGGLVIYDTKNER